MIQDAVARVLDDMVAGRSLTDVHLASGMRAALRAVCTELDRRADNVGEKNRQARAIKFALMEVSGLFDDVRKKVMP